MGQSGHVQMAGRLHEAEMSLQREMRGRDRFARQRVKGEDDFLMEGVAGAEDIGKS